MNPRVISIRPITHLDQASLEKICPGYSSSSVFEVLIGSSATNAEFSLRWKERERPFEKKHDYSDPSVLAHYNEIAARGWSYGAFSEENLVGFIVGEVLDWNSTLAVREFGVLPEQRKQGIGKALLEEIIHMAGKRGLRGILCETQSTNVPAIQFYRKLGFTIQGVDLSLYSNQDYERGEVAIFLRKALS